MMLTPDEERVECRLLKAKCSLTIERVKYVRAYLSLRAKDVCVC
jgi:hypothetical protein